MSQPLTGPLVGQHILVTRPVGQAATLMAGIEQLGGRVTHIPFLAIEPASDLVDLGCIAAHIETYQACIFVSANAVHSAWSLLTGQQPWPESLAAAVVGPGTARVLRKFGVSHVVQPEVQFDSEGLLALPFFSSEQCEGRAFALIRGEGGRDLIARTLRERGGRVDEATVYQRSLDPDAVMSALRLMDTDQPSAMIVTSSESLQRFLMAAPDSLAQVMRRLTMVVPHARIAQTATDLGYENVVVCEGGDEGILRFLRTYNE
jgi:uroporphyrinogen-III synthase